MHHLDADKAHRENAGWKLLRWHTQNSSCTATDIPSHKSSKEDEQNMRGSTRKEGM